MSDETTHEAVVSSLLDLQARLRNDGVQDQAEAKTSIVEAAPPELVRIPEATPVFVNLPEGNLPMASTDKLSVAEGDVTIEVATDEDSLLHTLTDDDEGYFAPVTPLHPASSGPTESRLEALAERLSRLEGELDGVLGRIEKVDPVRIERLEKVHDELDAQHEGLKATIESHFTDLQRSIDERLRGTEV